MKTYKYTINGNKYEVVIGDIKDNVVSVTVNGEGYNVEMEAKPEPERPKAVVRPVVVQAAEPAVDSKKRPSVMTGAVKAPLPGVITEIKVSVGDEVKAGEPVGVLEAMKMANNLEAEKAGKVSEICVQPGQSVMEGDVLVVIE